MLWEEDDDALGVDDDSLTLPAHFCTPLVWGHPSSCAIAWDDAANTSLGCWASLTLSPAFTPSPQKPRKSSALIRKAIIRNVPETRY